jgi:hypothetical protein
MASFVPAETRSQPRSFTKSRKNFTGQKDLEIALKSIL